MVACDFFSKRIYTLRGVPTAYVLVFIHLGSRKVYCSAPTLHPDKESVRQQARNASIRVNDMAAVKPRFPIHDRGTKPGHETHQEVPRVLEGAHWREMYPNTA